MKLRRSRAGLVFSIAACTASLTTPALVCEAGAYDYKNPPPAVWTGEYKPFFSHKQKDKVVDSGIKSLSITGADRKFHVDGSLTDKKETVAIKKDFQIADENGAAGKFQNLYALCKGVKGEPFVIIKADNYTTEGQAHPGQYYFYSCYFTAGDAGNYLSGRLIRTVK